VSTSFSNLKLVPELNFYGKAKRKLLVVISDTETGYFDPNVVKTAFASHHVGLVLVQVSSGHDRIWENEMPTLPIIRNAPKPERSPLSIFAARSAAPRPPARCVDARRSFSCRLPGRAGPGSPKTVPYRSSGRWLRSMCLNLRPSPDSVCFPA
jgi:hypothetical protein